MKLQLKRSLKTITNSALAQAPSVEQMEYGEIAINYVSSDPSIFLKDSTNTIRKMQLSILPDLATGTEQSGTLDDRYILNSGDTLTGNLSGPSFIGGVARMSAIAPAAGEDGELWWNNNDGRLYIYYNDGVTAQWVDASPDSFTLGAGYYDKNEADARFIGKSGGIMTGILQLAGNPATDLAASPKQYVDAQSAAAQTAAQNFATAAIASIPPTDLSSYDTSAQVDAKISANTPDLSNYSGNISTDGSATFDGAVTAGGATRIGDISDVNPTAGGAALAYDDSIKSTKIYANSSTNVGASVDFHFNGSATAAASIDQSGNTTFAGVIQSDGDANGGVEDGSTMNGGSGFSASFWNGSSPLWRGYTTGNSTPTSQINVDGSATFAGAEFTGVTVKGDSVNPGTLELNCEDNSHTVAIKAPAHSVGANYTLTLPPNTGNSGQILTTDGTGSLTWSTPSATADLTNYDTSTEVDAKITSAALSLSSLPALP